MKTNLILVFTTDGAKPSEVVEKVKAVGFKVAVGRYDFVYDWEKDVTPEEIIALGDKLTEALRGTGVSFKLESD